MTNFDIFILQIGRDIPKIVEVMVDCQICVNKQIVTCLSRALNNYRLCKNEWFQMRFIVSYFEHLIVHCLLLASDATTLLHFQSVIFCTAVRAKVTGASWRPTKLNSQNESRIGREATTKNPFLSRRFVCICSSGQINCNSLSISHYRLSTQLKYDHQSSTLKARISILWVY